ncbi:S41 family peptidase [Candidatus Formimonas warabiya]|uniref:PDZ domain-containing protein n=1 Tax=Formimonas warabiya TaxID=1761012 RepID=A0A3G1KN45_FORW1|nr:S41 family peptidase [Candidatus Formimonas warabiya]ATW23883.1 hypothetical protein DCMF_02880 [Candidatus Formimonas warabiya]
MKKKFYWILVFSLIFMVVGTCAAYGDNNLNEVKNWIQTRYYQDVDPSVLSKPTVQEMVYALNDPYSTYIDPKQFPDFLSSLDGKYVGVGMYINEVNGKVQVLSPMKGSPAEKAGLKEGDIITHVNGETTKGLSSSEVAGKIRGLEGTKVTVSVLRGKEAIKFTVTRATIKVPSLEYKLIGPGIGYIKLYSFTSDAPQEMSDALDELQAQNIQTLVLDLRDDPGGLLDAAVDIAGNFVPKGPVVYVVQKGGKENVLRTFKKPRGLPIAVLVNEGTASAAEILAGSIQDAKTGILIGTKTFGKGCVQTIFTLSNGGGLKLTTAKYLTRGRQDINSKGLTPNILEPDPDKQLEKAVKMLGDNISLFDVQLTLGSPKVFVGFHTYDLPVSPYILNGNVMVPLREIAQYCGASVQWKNGKVIVTSPKGKLEVDLASKIISVGSGTIKGKAVVKNGYTMVPARLLAEALGYRIGWQEKAQSIYLVD